MNMVKVFIKGLEDKELSSFLRYYPARIKISLSGNTFEKKKEGAEPTNGFGPNCYLCFRHKISDNMGKGSVFFGQPPEDTKIQ